MPFYPLEELNPGTLLADAHKQRLQHIGHHIGHHISHQPERPKNSERQCTATSRTCDGPKDRPLVANAYRLVSGPLEERGRWISTSSDWMNKNTDEQVEDYPILLPFISDMSRVCEGKLTQASKLLADHLDPFFPYPEDCDASYPQGPQCKRPIIKLDHAD